ncbi:MAG: hypothetical protein HYU02_01125 [Thaumarchaeota archaeon]|nr:hypothetical protein [Nitrososphaerota archaeon]
MRNFKQEIDYRYSTEGTVESPSDEQRKMFQTYLATHHTTVVYPFDKAERRRIRDNLLREQGDKCACCRLTHAECHAKNGIDCNRPEDRRYCFVLDHDHHTWFVRVAICSDCNSGLWYYLGE